MNNQILSQDEIDALLKGSESTEEESTFLTPQEIKALGDIFSYIFDTTSKVLSPLLNKKTQITAPKVTLINRKDINERFIAPVVIGEIHFQKSFKGNNIILLQVPDVLAISNLKLGQDIASDRDELNEAELTAVGELLSQVADALAPALNVLLNRPVEINQSNVKLLNIAENDLSEFPTGDKIVQTTGHLTIEDVIDSELNIFSSITFAREFAGAMLAQNAVSQEKPLINEMDNEQENQSITQVDNKTIATTQQVSIQPAQFAPIGPAVNVKESSNLGLILDVSLKLTVELGSTKMRIKDILELGSGSIIELEKLAGEPVDILVNGKIIAKGEVVVIDENFGVKVTDIVSSIERVHSLQ